MSGGMRKDRRSNGNKDEFRRGDDKKRDNKDDRRSGRGGGNNQPRHSSGGNDRNNQNNQNQYIQEARMGGGGGGGHQQQFGNGSNMGGSGGGGGGGRNLNAFNGLAFTESQLMDEVPKKKFTGRCRLFVGNIPNEVKEAELKELFKTYGDIAECYLSGKGFAFLRLDTRAHAESAKEAIDGRVIHGRQVRVRFAVHGAAIRVKELSPTVSNEMLYHAFSHFGDVERAVHIVDEKGRPTGEGIVEFERKPNCNEAMASIREKVFLLTASPKPLVVEVLDPRDEDDGLAERMIPRTPGLAKERELGPRFPAPNTFEYVYGMKWKELYDVEKKRRAQLEDELRESRRRLEADMELAYQDYQAQMLREDLQRRQQELERLEASRRERMRGMGQMQGGPPVFQQPGFMGVPPPQAGGPPPFAHGFPTNQPPPNMFHQQGGGGGPPGGPPPMAQLMAQGGPGGPQGGGGPPSMMQNPQQGGKSNMIEGVQRLLQIFKTDPSSQSGLLGRGDFSGPPPQGNGGGMMYNNGPQYHDFPPPEKKSRR